MSNNDNGSNNNPYVHMSPIQTNRPNPMDTVCDALNHCSRKVGDATKRAEILADNLWNHIRIGSSLADAAVARIVQGTKVLTLGGSDALFQQSFGVFPGEKLIKSFACYLSTSTGPVIGTLHISNLRLAFCSDYPLCHYPFSQQQNQTLHYKVVVQVDQLSTVSPSSNRFNPAEKYIELVTVDGYEFYLMGFIAYDKALKTIREVLQQYHNHSREA
ncbi:hypothetical protein PHAVU_011G162600 [Phaseolus vulgaris]|uniref:GRAM domain-containing protein n=2 Tax=Phaseolus vulgaris TaxID=3885 RepID=V7AJ17_PHAVU|nr:hypothetical protein PHAVU_011G162600g [Phaseolus vulgaris]ESW05225.1 hypothetical protein PHAVU_011G162600g [Phaseolus vulgaris]